MKKHNRLALLGVIMMWAVVASAQRIGVGTNALYWGTLTPNASLHVRTSNRSSLNLEFSGRPGLSIGPANLKWLNFSPEVRFWLGKRTGMQRHFVGIVGQAASYRVRWKDDNHKGELLGLGVSYGYDWMLTKRLNLEVTAGLGAFYNLDNRNHRTDGDAYVYDRHLFVAPIKLGVNLIYFIR